MKKPIGTFYTEPEPEELGRDPRLSLSIKILKQLQDSIGNVIQLLESGTVTEAQAVAQKLTVEKQMLDMEVAESTGVRVVEGVFDGSSMVGSDGNLYNVPPNYASKSRLVEGDMLKLTIKTDGSFLYKQIAPIERRRVVGALAEDSETREYVGVSPDGHRWKLVRAAITYFRGAPGDEVVMLVPKSAPSTWAAVENVVKR